MIIQPLLQKAFSPLKDKGETPLILQSLKEQRNEVEVMMVDLVDLFKKKFRRPWTTHLSMQRATRGQVYVRWRTAGKNGVGQSHFKLFGSEHGFQILRQQTEHVRQVFIELEGQRIALNMVHSILNQTSIRVKQYQQDKQQTVTTMQQLDSL